MPFQVTYSQRALPTGVIQSIDAGGNASAVCDISFTLTATVIGDLDGHTIVWEQVGGSSVTFDTPLDQLSVTYSQTTFDDKTFRFWVDKGTASERFDDVSIFGSPTSEVTDHSTSLSKRVFNNSTLNQSGDTLLITVLTPYPLTPHDGVAAVRTYTTATLLWFPAESNYTVLGYIVKERNDITGVWNDIAVLSPTTRLFDGVTLGNTYQVATLFSYDNSHIGQVGSNVVWINGALRDSDVSLVDASTSSISLSTITDSDYLVERLVILVCDPGYDAINNCAALSKHSYISNYDSEQFVLTQYSAPVDEHYSTITLTNRINITLYDVTVLTGQVIGGS